VNPIYTRSSVHPRLVDVGIDDEVEELPGLPNHRAIRIKNDKGRREVRPRQRIQHPGIDRPTIRLKYPRL